MNRARGEGSIFRERYRDKRTREWKTSRTWTIKYSYLGNQRKESSGSPKRSDAAQLLQRRLSEIPRGRLIGPALQRPEIRGLAEHNVRQGFFELPEARGVFAHLPADLVAPFEVAAMTGWRIKSEILTRQKGHLDLHAGWLRLEPGETKNRKGR